MSDPEAPVCDVLWPWAYRIIPSRFPPVNVFESYYDSGEEMEIAFALEAHTNPRLRNEAGDVGMVPLDERVWGTGASWVMAAFTHVASPSRFSDGSHGVYYAAESVETAIAETRFHRERFMQAAKSPSITLTMRILRNQVLKPCHDLRGAAFVRYLDPDTDTYPVAQRFAKTQRAAGSWGLLYPSVRRKRGECVALFRPKAMSLAVEDGHLEYEWDGQEQRIVDVRELK